MKRQAGEVELRGDENDVAPVPLRDRAMAAQVHVESGFSGGDLDVERLARGRQAFGERTGDPRRALRQAGLGDRAERDVHHVVAARRHIADAHRSRENGHEA